MRPALVTDSNSQLPDDLRDRFDVEVVPVTVVIDGQEYLEGVDLDADGFYELFADGAAPDISTSLRLLRQYKLLSESAAPQSAVARPDAVTSTGLAADTT